MPAQPEKNQPPRQEMRRGGGSAVELSRLVRKLSPSGLEPEDLLLLLVVYLLYRESGDRELLITLGALLLL